MTLPLAARNSSHKAAPSGLQQSLSASKIYHLLNNHHNICY
jgi:hypothetical protein